MWSVTYYREKSKTVPYANIAWVRTSYDSAYVLFRRCLSLEGGKVSLLRVK